MPRIIRRGQSNASGLTIQPGSKITYKQDGSLEAMLIQEGDQTAAAGAPGINSAHPREPRALAYNVDHEYLKNGKLRVTAAYIGVSSDPTPWFLEGQGSLDKESILTHPDFVGKIGGTKDAPLNKAKYDEETGEFIGFPADAENNLAGVDSWFVPSVIYRFTQWTYRQPNFRDLGKIDSPPVSVQRPASVKDYLNGSGTYRQVGNLYQVTIELWGSGPKGWNKTIYSR